MAINDLSVIDRLSTRARREGSVLFVEVLDGVTVLSSDQYTNATNITPAEVPKLLEHAMIAAIRGATGGGGAGVVSRPASTSLVLDAVSVYDPLAVVGATAFAVSGTTKGVYTSIVVTANGTNIPTVTGATEWGNSFGYLNTSGVKNLLTVWNNGESASYSWSQALVPSGSDNTAPVLQSASVTEGTLVLTYNESLLTALPATSAFSVVGAGGVTQAPSSVAISGSTVTLTLSTPSVVDNTVTVSYTVPGSNPIRDLAGNSATALTNYAVTNATESGSSILKLTTLTKLGQGSGASEDTYLANATGVGTFEARGTTPLTMAGDGWVSVDWPSSTNGAVMVGFDTEPTQFTGTTTRPILWMALSTNSATIYQGSGMANGQALKSIAASPTFRARMRRAGSTLFIETSTDAGVSWTLDYTFGTTLTGPLYVWMFTGASNTIYRPRQSGMA